MRLINLIGLFLLLPLFAVEGQNLAIGQPGKELCQHPRLLFSKQEGIEGPWMIFGTEPLLDSWVRQHEREAESFVMGSSQVRSSKKRKTRKLYIAWCFSRMVNRFAYGTR